MPRHIAFLRAINVGGHTVTMDQLRRQFVALNFSNVETFIASGNVVFDSTSGNAEVLERKIEEHLEKKLGYPVATFLRSDSELARVASRAAGLGAKGTTLYVAFTSATPSAATKKKLMTFTSEVDDFRIHGREVYWLCRKTISTSNFSGALLEKTLGMQATVRGAGTIAKMAAKFCV